MFCGGHGQAGTGGQQIGQSMSILALLGCWEALHRVRCLLVQGPLAFRLKLQVGAEDLVYWSAL